MLGTWLIVGETGFDLPWSPSYGMRLHFRLDGLAALYALLATGIGFAVFAYSRSYLPIHLAHQGRPASDERRFYGFMLLFMVSMVGLVTAQDLIALFIFWDLTAIASYFLIGYDRHERDSRRAALMALLITGVSAVLLLIGILMLREKYGTFSLPILVEEAYGDTHLTVATLMVMIAALAKSAQVPFHYWLPRAMAAPTPVSAYLHSAAMVAAGVFLIGRFYPLISQSDFLLDVLLIVGAASMLTGGLLALTRDRLKQLLAYSTISQYGYVTMTYGLGGRAGALGASFYVIAHALAKSSLFLTAGAVTAATGEDRLSRIGGLARRMPLLAVASAVAAMGLAALPLTIGFFKDELFFAAAIERGPLAIALAVTGAALTFAYIGRFWLGLFAGPVRVPATVVPRMLVVPVAVLAGLIVVGGFVVAPFEQLAAAAAEVSLGESVLGKAAYHLDVSGENVMAFLAYAFGLGLLFSRRFWIRGVGRFARAGEVAGPERFYTNALTRLNAISDAIHDLEVRDLRTRVAAVLLPAGVLAVIGLIVTPTAGAFMVGPVDLDNMALMLVLVVCAIAAIAVVFPRNHLTLVLTFSTVGFSLAVAFALFGAPDVALVAVLVETLFALLFLGVFSLLPPAVLRREARLPATRRRQIRDPIVGAVAGGVAFLVVWAALSRPAPEESVAAAHVELAPDAHGKDVVTTILADFRGLDTLGEITVVGIAMIGIATMVQRGKMR